ncbi:YfhH family protein [Metabacillus indicus]|uniref:YfhH family protein n=1 Tax=Metabacillus indicus TaxID=246786 RepID=UPI003CF46007
MQTKRYSTMTEYELKTEIAALSEKARKAEQLGMVNEFAVLDRKITMAKAYLLNPDEFKPGEIYEIEGAPGSFFKIDYMNGVFAWGNRLESPESEEEGIPISMLGRKKEENEPR